MHTLRFYRRDIIVHTDAVLPLRKNTVLNASVHTRKLLQRKIVQNLRLCVLVSAFVVRCAYEVLATKVLLLAILEHKSRYSRACFFCYRRSQEFYLTAHIITLPISDILYFLMLLRKFFVSSLFVAIHM